MFCQRLPSRVKKITVFPIFALLMAASPPSIAQDLVITGVVDGPLSGGLPKAIELCALSDIPDLSAYGIGSTRSPGLERLSVIGFAVTLLAIVAHGRARVVYAFRTRGSDDS